MGVFFSGEDDKDLKEQALYHYYYVSVIVDNDQKVIARLSHKLSESQAQSVFGEVKIDKNVVYYDMEVEVEKSVDYTKQFTQALNSMKDMRKSYQRSSSKNHSASKDFGDTNWNLRIPPPTGNYKKGRQGEFWDKENWNPNLANNPTRVYQAEVIDDQDILNLFNENELLIGDNTIQTLDELENKLSLYYHLPEFDETMFLEELVDCWLNEFADIEENEVIEVFSPEHNNLRYLFRKMYGSTAD